MFMGRAGRRAVSRRLPGRCNLTRKDHNLRLGKGKIRDCEATRRTPYLAYPISHTQKNIINETPQFLQNRDTRKKDRQQLLVCGRFVMGRGGGADKRIFLPQRKSRLGEGKKKKEGGHIEPANGTCLACLDPSSPAASTRGVGIELTTTCRPRLNTEYY